MTCMWVQVSMSVSAGPLSAMVPQALWRMLKTKLRPPSCKVIAHDAGHHLAAFCGADDVDHGGSKHWPFQIVFRAGFTSGMPSAAAE